jgi:hypothetical protein
MAARGWEKMEDLTAIFQRIFHLLQAISQELQEPDHVLMSYQHRYATQGANTHPPRQLPVYPPNSERIPEADFDPLPPDR